MTLVMGDIEVSYFYLVTLSSLASDSAHKRLHFSIPPRASKQLAGPNCLMQVDWFKRKPLD